MATDLGEACLNNLTDCWVALAGSGAINNNDSIQACTGIGIPLFNPIFLKECARDIPPILQHVPVMSINLDTIPKQTYSPPVMISQVDNAQDLNEWITPVQIAFDMEKQAALEYQRALERIHQQWIHYVVRINSHIVAAASLFLHSEMAGFYNLAVLPEFRKQGIATALHDIRFYEAKKRGYQYATLQAAPMAVSLDKTLGFETHSELSIYQ